MNFTTEYLLKESVFAKASFVGMNTGIGFSGRYSDIIDERKLKRLYIIKGAAGTGKSTLMKSIAETCEGEGHSVSCYLCSSDPDSLDCIVIDGAVAVLDGTSPHALDMKYPGAVSEIIDLTDFWDTEILISRRSDIIRLTDEKKRAFLDGYALLAEVSNLGIERYNTSVRAVLLDKLDKYTTRLISSLGKGKGSGKRSELIVRSVGMKGLQRLDTLERMSDNVISVVDVYASAYHFMDILEGKLAKNGFDFILSRDPVMPSLICDIYIPKTRTLITLDHSDKCSKRVNMTRFVDNRSLGAIRGVMRLSLKCSDSLLMEVQNMFSLGGSAHFKLERIYSSAMNFDLMNSYADDLRKRILSLL